MSLHRAPLLLWGAVLGSFVLGTFCASPSHSLSYSYLQLSEPTQGQNQFLIRGYLDDQPIIRFDSHTWKMEPLVPWMEEVEKEMFLVPEWVFRDDLDKLSKRDQHAGGLHTWQVNLGCELKEDGSKRGFLHYGYDGMDFISFDQETHRWVTAQPLAEKVKKKWEEDPGWFHGNKVFLEETCIECLQRHLSYQKEVLQRIEPPVGKVTRKVVDGSLEVLICQAFGFYPKEIRSTWTRDGEVCQYETLHKNMAPNSDGTYYVLLSIEIHPKERDHFRCYLEHEGLREPLVLALKEETANIWWISLGIVIAMILILFLICLWWRFRKNISQQVKSDYIFPEMAAFPLVYGTESEIQSQRIIQPQVTVENALKAPVSKLSTQNQKHQRLTRCQSSPGELGVSLQTPAEAGATEFGVRMIRQPMDSPGSLFQCPEVSEAFKPSGETWEDQPHSYLGGFLSSVGLWWQFLKNTLQPVKSGYIISEMAAFPLVYGTEDEIQSQTILQPQVTVEHEASCGSWGPQNALKAPVSKLSMQKQKHQRLTRCQSSPGELGVSLQTPAEAGATESGVRMISQPMDSPGSLFQCLEGSEGFQSWWSGSELSEDGHKHGSYQNACDGEDFISLDRRSCTWARDEIHTLVTKRRREVEPFVAKSRNNILEKEWMKPPQKFMMYGKDCLLKKDRPVAEITPRIQCNHKDCQGHGFCSKEDFATKRKYWEDVLQTQTGFRMPGCIEGDGPVAEGTPSIQCNHKDCQDYGFCLEGWKLSMKELNTRTELMMPDFKEGVSSQDSERPPVGPSAE
ncbi:uncharacterized protein LOC116503352 isoform X1 [Thamnophis elegans]|uniref:uncharacterized protein LOC116503352 isoform X1 n=1 Tax=Thamnophis elegans TaxID=35005 RepID=UPI001378016E|nr:uncharacterized protein LOC116503352 isoform X1 [Thamnophis elegans]